jgi:hypothetical protein
MTEFSPLLIFANEDILFQASKSPMVPNFPIGAIIILRTNLGSKQWVLFLECYRFRAASLLSIFTEQLFFGVIFGMCAGITEVIYLSRYPA